jgi:hypothetical protein
MAEGSSSLPRGPEDLGFTEEQLGSNHVCLIYNSDDDRHQLVGRYLAAGLRQGEIVQYFRETTSPEGVRSWMQEAGVDVQDAEDSGCFLIVGAGDAYCPNGIFDPEEVLDRIGRGFEVAHRAGWTGTRSTGEMAWAHRGFPGSERLLEYEALLNAVSTPYRHSGMCQYDARLFDGATLFRVLEVHPFMVAEGQIVRNPYYRRPDEEPEPSTR